MEPSAGVWVRQVYASCRPIRAGRLAAISAASALAREWKLFFCTMAQAAVVAPMNVAKSFAAMTGVRSAPRYRFRVSTRIAFSCSPSVLLLREDAGLLTPDGPAGRSPDPQPVIETMSNKKPVTDRV